MDARDNLTSGTIHISDSRDVRDNTDIMDNTKNRGIKIGIRHNADV